MLLSNKQLKDYVDCGQDRVLIRWLNQHGIAWWGDAKGRPCTTMEAVNSVLLNREQSRDL